MKRQDVATLALVEALEANPLHGWKEVKVSPFLETDDPTQLKAAVIATRDDGESFQIFVYANTYRPFGPVAEDAVARLLTYTHCDCKILGLCVPADPTDMRGAALVHPCAVHGVEAPSLTPPNGLLYRLNEAGRKYFAATRKPGGTVLSFYRSSQCQHHCVQIPRPLSSSPQR